jgi:endonuclease/exonuclease/phosphatase family metal-dependent hydrolase
MSRFVVMSWNIDARVLASRRESAHLAQCGEADVVLLQEVPRRSAAALSDAAGFAWDELAVMQPNGDDARSAGVSRFMQCDAAPPETHPKQ